MTEKQIQENIPSISMQDKKVVVETILIPLIVDGQEVMIKMRKLTAGEKRDLVKECANMKVIGSQPTGTVDAIGYQIGLLSKVITEAPFEINNASISALPDEVTDYLYNQYSELTKSKKKD